MPRPTSDVQTRILRAIDRQLRTLGAAALTIENVAAETGCAKGLVTYHFKTKSALLAAAAEKLFQERDTRWRSALSASTLDDAISQSWRLISGDVSSGFWKAQASLAACDKLTVQTVNNAEESFAKLMATLVESLLREMGLKPSVKPDELGHLVSAGIQGFGMQLLNGLSAEHVEGAYAALWVALLSLTHPAVRY